MFDHDIPNVRVITHSAIRIESAAGTVLYADPYQLTEAPHDADIVLVTHTHYDHLSPQDVARVAGPQTTLVAPASAQAELGNLPFAQVETLSAGETLELADIRIEGVPAYNTDPSRLEKHPQANAWLGYVATVDGVRIYIAGDTDENPDNVQVTCDVALVPCGGTYTMDAAQAAAFVNRIRPAVAVPTHYGAIVGSAADAELFAHAVDPAIDVRIKMER